MSLNLSFLIISVAFFLLNKLVELNSSKRLALLLLFHFGLLLILNLLLPAKRVVIELHWRTSFGLTLIISSALLSRFFFSHLVLFKLDFFKVRHRLRFYLLLLSFLNCSQICKHILSHAALFFFVLALALGASFFVFLLDEQFSIFFSFKISLKLNLFLWKFV